jgi:hypothetical protein
MVYKPALSPVHFKVEGSTGTPLELIDSNTVVNQWQELTYDFSAAIGNSYNRLVILPDFYARPQENIIYFDNIQVPDGMIIVLPEPTTSAPTPTHPAADVISIYSDAYNNVPNTNYNPSWGQSTVVTVNHPIVPGDSVLKYENLNYQGTEFTSQDVSGYDSLHVDFWTPNATALEFFLISPGNETAYILPITLEQWVSVDIPLTHYDPPVNLSEVFQFKVVGNGTVYFDNYYFWRTSTAIKAVDDLVPAKYNLEQNYPNPFNPTTSIRFSLPAANQVVLKVFNILGEEVVTLVNEFMNAGTYEVDFDATQLGTGTYIYSISAGDFTSVKKMVLIK